MRRLFLKIDKKYAGRTVRSLLSQELHLSSSLISKQKRVPFGITVDGVQVHTDFRSDEGQILGVVIGASRENFSYELPYEILFEDDDILIINKPSGAAAHGSRYDDKAESVEAEVNRYYGNAEMYHPVSRLDRGTSGIMTIAKNGYMHERLIFLLHTDGFIRSYLGIVCGHLEEKEGTVSLPIARVEGSAIKREVRSDGQSAETCYKVLREYEEYSLVRFILKTGRTHQIRVHMSHLGHPLVGDWLYGKEDTSIISRPALHSATLGFTHPMTNERIMLDCEMPEDMKKLIE